MNRYFNIFYLSIIAIGIALFFLVNPKESSIVSFYGFAETNETEINFNYPVVINKIFVTPGQHVKKDDVLMQVSRMNNKDKLEQEPFKIAEIQAEKNSKISKLESEIDLAKASHQITIEKLDTEIEKLTKELNYKIDLAKDLENVELADNTYTPLRNKIDALKNEKTLLVSKFNKKQSALLEEINVVQTPYNEQIKLLNAEKAFFENNKVQLVEIKAPTDGLIGNLHCKEAEHIQSYTTLISFYEPNPSIIRGFIHEDLTLQVTMDDSFVVRSIKDPSIQYEGKVIGLGSRIVEIPQRLRKIAEFKTYGREVSIRIDSRNAFLQKEKVALELGNLQTISPTVENKNKR